MNTKSIFSILTATALVGIGSSAQAQVATDAVGFTSKEIPANSDGTYSPSLHRPAVFTGVIESIVDADTIEIANADFSPNGFSTGEPHYVLIGSGDREGLFAQITGNTADQVDLTFVVQNLGDTQGDQVVAGDEVKIIPFWTLGTLLPDGEVPAGTSVLLYDRSVNGTNLSANTIYTMFAGFGWFAGPTNGNNEIIAPDESFIIRAPAGEAVSLTQVGAVPMEKSRTLLENTGGADQDIRITTGLPIPVALGEFLNPGAPAAGDSVLIFDEANASQNKSASAIATYFDGFGWFAGPTDMNGFLIQPNQGIIYRKLGSNAANDLVVEFQPAFQQ